MITSRVWPTRPARTSYGPLPGKPRIAADVPDFGCSASVSAGAFNPSTRSTARSLRGSNDTATASRPGSRPRSSTPRVLLPRDHVRVRDHQTRRRRPSPSPRRRARTRSRGSSRRSRAAARTPSARAIDAVGAGTRASGPSMRGNGSSRASASISPLDGGSHVLSWRRIVERCTSRRASPPLASASAPSTQRDPEPDARGQHRARHAVQRRGRGRSHPPAQSRPDAFESDREHHPGDQRTDESERRRPGRAAAVVEQQRPDARPHPGADREPDQRERARHETLRPAEQAEQHHDAHDQPVDAGHAIRAYRRARTVTVVEHDEGPARAQAARDRESSALRPAGRAAALVALIAGIVIGARHVPPEHRTIEAFTQAWERGDHAAMYALLSDAARQRTSLARLQRTYRQAAETITLQSVKAGPVNEGNTVAGLIRDPHLRPAARHAHAPHRRAQGRRSGHRLARRARLSRPAPRREAAARDRRCPSGPRSRPATARRSPRGPSARRISGPIASEIAGNIGPAPPELAAQLEARGVPTGAAVGLTGLEREFDERLRGTPGGTLFAGDRVLARKTRPSAAARSGPRSIPRSSAPRSRRSPAATAGSRSCDRATARCWRSPGSPSRRRSRPGSTFKIVTLAGVLEAKVAKRIDDVPDPDRRDDRGRRDPERQRRVVRRLAAQQLRALVQLGLRAAGRRARRQAARRGPPSASASTRTRRWPARPARRSPPPPRSATTSRSARARSARARS